MNSLLQTLRALGATKLIALGGVALALIAFFVFLTGRLAAPDMALLYADLEAGDSSQIVQKLEAMGVPYELKGDGTQIMVPRDRVLRLRMAMAEQGLPTGGSIGYEIFDRSDSLGTTNFVQRVNHLRALEGELARTIRSIAAISAARVHLVLPERALFSRDQPKPTASIFITTRRGATLDPAQVQAIQHLVAAAVPGLKPSAVSIVDNWGTLLAKGGDGVADAADGGDADSKRIAYERRVAHSIEDLLQRSLGYGSVRVEVSADMDFDRITTNSEIYDPDGQVVRSTQTVEEKSDTGQGEGSQAVSVTSNLPDPTTETAPSATTGDHSARTEETVNYEISKKVETHVRETGVVKRLSVAVLVDGTYEPGPDGSAPVYKPRSAEELKQIEKLVRSAAGIDQSRGDTVEVVNMRFAQDVDASEPAGGGAFMGLEKADLIRIGQIAVLGLLGVLALLFVGRPLVERLLASPAAGAAAAMLPRPAVAAALPAGGQAEPAPAGAPDPGPETMIDVDQVEGRVKASSIKKMAEIVQNHPEEAVNIMRSWMYQEGR
ncbi:MAG: flagellar M-ring protein FliF [Rhodospirillaceae bacterium]|nr:flagellar M-ring protein FliF [Rhodospirillaceae bacterium]